MGLFQVFQKSKTSNKKDHEAPGTPIKIPFDETLDPRAEGIHQCSYRKKPE
jgi:hypothetical protein